MAARKISAEDKVRQAYARVAAGQRSSFVKLLDLRYALCAKGLDFTAQDAAYITGVIYDLNRLQGLSAGVVQTSASNFTNDAAGVLPLTTY